MHVTVKNSGATVLAGIRALAACVFFMLAAVECIAQVPNVGWVVDVKSQSWHVNGRQESLTKGKLLPAEGILSNAAPTDGDYLVVANMHGDIIRRLRCSNSGCGACVQNDSCANPIAPLPKAPEEAGYLSAAIDGIKDLFGEHPERYSVHRSRGLSYSCISDTVVVFNSDGGGDLEGLLRNCAEGTYNLEIRAAGSTHGGGQGGSPREVVVSWNPANPSRAVPLDLGAGLYILEYTRDWMSGTAWVLLCPQSSCSAAAESYNAFAAIVDGWGEQVESETRIAYKRAYLDKLSELKDKK